MPTATINDLSVADLRLILCLLQHDNTSAAADELGIGQSTISYHLRRIRSLFNDDMFVRTGKGLKPTERCRQIGHLATELLARIDEELVHGGQFDPSQVDRELVMVADDPVCTWYGDFYHDLRQQMPRVNLCARPWNQHSLDDLDNGSVHFGLHIMSLGTKSLFEVELAPCYRVFVVRKGHPLEAKGYVSLKDLSDYPVILHDLAGWNTNGNSVLERACRQHHTTLNLKAKIGYVSSIFEALKHDNSISYTTVTCLPDDLSEVTLLLPPKEVNQIRSNHRLYISRLRYGSQESNYLVDLISKSFNRFLERKFDRPELAKILPIVIEQSEQSKN